MSADKRQAVLDTLTRALEDGEPITVSGIARAAGVGRSYVYNHPELRARIEVAQREQQGPAMTEEDWRTPCSVHLSALELQVIDDAAAKAGKTRGRYMREVLMAAVAVDLGLDPDELDPVRRSAPRTIRKQQERTQ
jgi:hypothetical protein